MLVQGQRADCCSSSWKWLRQSRNERVRSRLLKRPAVDWPVLAFVCLLRQGAVLVREGPPKKAFATARISLSSSPVLTYCGNECTETTPRRASSTSRVWQHPRERSLYEGPATYSPC